VGWGKKVGWRCTISDGSSGESPPTAPNRPNFLRFVDYHFPDSFQKWLLCVKNIHTTKSGRWSRHIYIYINIYKYVGKYQLYMGGYLGWWLHHQPLKSHGHCLACWAWPPGSFSSLGAQKCPETGVIQRAGSRLPSFGPSKKIGNLQILVQINLAWLRQKTSTQGITGCTDWGLDSTSTSAFPVPNCCRLPRGKGSVPGVPAIPSKDKHPGGSLEFSQHTKGFH